MKYLLKHKVRFDHCLNYGRIYMGLRRCNSIFPFNGMLKPGNKKKIEKSEKII